MLSKDYICGFIEGEGCFLIQRMKGIATYRFIFAFNQRRDDIEILKQMQKALNNTGRLRIYGRYVRFEIITQPHIAHLISYLGDSPFVGKKKKDYVILKEAFNYYTKHKSSNKAEVRKVMDGYLNKLKAAKQFSP